MTGPVALPDPRGTVTQHVTTAREMLAAVEACLPADIAIFAYAGRAEDAGLSLEAYPHFREWMTRVASQPGHLDAMVPYSVDPHSINELPG